MRRTAFDACALSASLLASTLMAQTGAYSTLAGPNVESLRVRVLPPIRDAHQPLRYELNQPAYVAAFIVYPGAGVRLLYPEVNVAERLQPAGFNSEQLFAARFDNDAYNAVLGPTLSGPAYLYVIASKHPLNVAQYVHRPMHLASATGYKEVRSFYADVAFDAILNNAVTLGDESSWDADVFTLWPGVEGTQLPPLANRVHYALIFCRNGTTLRVPDNYPFQVCPGDRHVKPVPQTMKVTQQRVASARAPALQTGGAAALMVGANSPAAGPTVLPTIVGKRAPAAGGAASDRVATSSSTPRAVEFTMANGDQQSPSPSAEQVAQPTTVTVIGSPTAAQRGFRDRHGVHNRYSPQRRDGRDRASDADGSVVGRAPQIAPSPQLAPNPQLAPAPNVARPQAVAAPRAERPERPERAFERPRPVGDRGAQTSDRASAHPMAPAPVRAPAAGQPIHNR